MRRQNIKIKKRYGTVTVSGQILPTFNFNKFGCSSEKSDGKFYRNK